jgi:hypothetical protein
MEAVSTKEFYIHTYTVYRRSWGAIQLGGFSFCGSSDTALECNSCV